MVHENFAKRSLQTALERKCKSSKLGKPVVAMASSRFVNGLDGYFSFRDYFAESGVG